MTDCSLETLLLTGLGQKLVDHSAGFIGSWEDGHCLEIDKNHNYQGHSGVHCNKQWQISVPSWHQFCSMIHSLFTISLFLQKVGGI